MALAVIDSIYSLRAKYEAHALPAVNAYCRAIPGLEDASARFDPLIPEHGLKELVELTLSMTDVELVRLFGGNWQVAPGTKTRKAVVVRAVASQLLDVKVDCRTDLADASLAARAKTAALAVKGVGPAAWRYILLLSGVEQVKPDTMITRWVRRIASDDNISPQLAADALQLAARDLGSSVMTVRAADHLVWRYESGRLEQSQARLTHTA